MKTIKKIILTVLIVFAMFQFLGHDIAPIIHHIKCDIESNSESKTGDKSQSCIVSMDEEVAINIPHNPLPAILIIKEKHVSLSCFFPHKLYYSIWLPPDIS